MRNGLWPNIPGHRGSTDDAPIESNPTMVRAAYGPLFEQSPLLSGDDPAISMIHQQQDRIRQQGLQADPGLQRRPIATLLHRGASPVHSPLSRQFGLPCLRPLLISDLEREEVERRRVQLPPVRHGRDVGERAVVVARQAELARHEGFVQRRLLRAARLLEPHVHLASTPARARRAGTSIDRERDAQTHRDRERETQRETQRDTERERRPG